MDINVGSGKTLISYHVARIGDDIVVTITGGDAHIGSVAVGFDGKKTIVTAKTHKDNFLTAPLLEGLMGEFSCRCVVMGGFHLDNISNEAIEEVLKNHDKGIKLVINYLKS